MPCDLKPRGMLNLLSIAQRHRRQQARHRHNARQECSRRSLAATMVVSNRQRVEYQWPKGWFGTQHKTTSPLVIQRCMRRSCPSLVVTHDWPTVSSGTDLSKAAMRQVRPQRQPLWPEALPWQVIDFAERHASNPGRLLGHTWWSSRAPLARWHG